MDLKMEWISVAERMPTPYEEVLVQLENGKTAVADWSRVGDCWIDILNKKVLEGVVSWSYM